MDVCGALGPTSSKDKCRIISLIFLVSRLVILRDEVLLDRSFVEQSSLASMVLRALFFFLVFLVLFR